MAELRRKVCSGIVERFKFGIFEQTAVSDLEERNTHASNEVLTKPGALEQISCYIEAIEKFLADQHERIQKV